ncbi:MAG TPA: NAD(P)-dependent oxidoreductase [Clostridiales bacterium]|nr:NAD(P)-dependent oxidoreductase [Clostridiales bacterium]
MKFLVLGATGMAGHTIAIYLQERGHDVTTFTTSPFPYCRNIIGDALDGALLKSVILEGGYDRVINCIGILNQACDRNPAQAVYLNSYLPHFVAGTIAGTRTRLIHMSTDCVFSGKSGQYHEHSFRDGETFYDRTKALGEVDDSVNLTFRNSIIGPDINENGIGLFNWFMRQNEPVQGYSQAIWTGVTTLVLARAMERAASENLTGIYNLVNNTVISKYDLLMLFNRILRHGKIKITPNPESKVNKSLINNRHDFSFQVPSYEQMVIEMKDWIIQHQSLYPHYRDQFAELR